MSVQAQTWVIDNSQHGGSAFLVLLMIANHAHADGTNAFPAIPTLAKECRMSARQITRIVHALEASGELGVDRSAGRLSHRYNLPLMNPDILSGLRETSAVPTLTNAALNHDISGVNHDIAVSPEQITQEEPREEQHSKKQSVAAPPLQSTRPHGTPDPLLSDPAVVIAREHLHLTPNPDQRKLIAATVTDIVAWDLVCKQFMHEGRDPKRVDWLIERYERARGQPAMKPAETPAEKEARLKRHFYGDTNAARHAARH